MRGSGLDNVKPDFLIHIPGDMGGNFAVVEVKSVLADSAGLAKDVRTLTAFRTRAEYERAILLVYGDGEHVHTLLKRLQAIAHAEPDLIQLNRVEIWRHALPNQPAFRIG